MLQPLRKVDSSSLYDQHLCGIKEVGGITIAQKLDTAIQPDMPESAIDTGCIDFVLSPEDIASALVRIAQIED
jgi:chemotaxis response regulator CheB